MGNAERIVFPDEIDFFQPYLTVELVGMGITIPVGSKIPSPRPAEFVVLILTGGQGRIGVISSLSQLTIDCYAATEERARFISERVRTLMNAAGAEKPGLASIVEAGNPVNEPNPTTPDQARYSQTFIAHLIGSAL